MKVILYLLMIILTILVPLPYIVFYDAYRLSSNFILLLIMTPFLFRRLNSDKTKKNGASTFRKLLGIILASACIYVALTPVLPRIIFYNVLYLDLNSTLGGFATGILAFTIVRSKQEIVDPVSTPSINPEMFISFSSKDKSLAESLFSSLVNEGYVPWISTKSIVVGQDYSDQIVKAIDDSEIFILLISENSVESRHVKTELERAFSKNLTIYPIKLTNTEIPSGWEYYLSTSQWLDYSKFSKDRWIPNLISILAQTKEDTTISSDKSD